LRGEISFNPIDFTLAVEQWDFVIAVHYLEPLLPRDPRRPVSA
jgi:hypothetical protein